MHLVSNNYMYWQALTSRPKQNRYLHAQRKNIEDQTFIIILLYAYGNSHVKHRPTGVVIHYKDCVKKTCLSSWRLLFTWNCTFVLTVISLFQHTLNLHTTFNTNQTCRKYTCKAQYWLLHAHLLNNAFLSINNETHETHLKIIYNG